VARAGRIVDACEGISLNKWPLDHLPTTEPGDYSPGPTNVSTTKVGPAYSVCSTPATPTVT